MRYWIFQAVERRYPLTEKLLELPGDRWRVTRYENEIRANDIVYFWLGGKNAGIYGWGVVGSQRPELTDEENLRADVSYEGKFTKPILKSAVLGVPELEELQVLRAPQGTNFRVTTDEARALNQLIRKAGFPCPPDPA